MSKSPVLKSHHWDKQSHSSAVEIQVHLQECMDKMKEEKKKGKREQKICKFEMTITYFIFIRQKQTIRLCRLIVLQRKNEFVQTF